ncbi:hypothetical protein FGG08_007262 [Glutinoglossum americanum]|uniref:Ankyrin repeat protein n=1 Tax=Glutinoglossum americanum TaxID=1670608 RepID=A0A9P8HR58_9PEZI|nr:hypothetical protein FGG08_007262 [Glutinoglossum americanum]
MKQGRTLDIAGRSALHLACLAEGTKYTNYGQIYDGLTGPLFGGKRGAAAREGIARGRINDLERSQKYKAIVRTLLDAGIDPFLVDDSGSTALHHACRAGNHANVQEILDHVKESMTRTVDGMYLLPDIWNRSVAALRRPWFPVMALLLMKNGCNQTPLHVAAEVGAVRVLSALLNTNCTLEGTEPKVVARVSFKYQELSEQQAEKCPIALGYQMLQFKEAARQLRDIIKYTTADGAAPTIQSCPAAWLDAVVNCSDVVTKHTPLECAVRANRDKAIDYLSQLLFVKQHFSASGGTAGRRLLELVENHGLEGTAAIIQRHLFPQPNRKDAATQTEDREIAAAESDPEAKRETRLCRFSIGGMKRAVNLIEITAVKRVYYVALVLAVINYLWARCGSTSAEPAVEN